MFMRVTVQQEEARDLGWPHQSWNHPHQPPSHVALTLTSPAPHTHSYTPVYSFFLIHECASCQNVRRWQ